MLASNYDGKARVVAGIVTGTSTRPGEPNTALRSRLWPDQMHRMVCSAFWETPLESFATSRESHTAPTLTDRPSLQTLLLLQVSECRLSYICPQIASCQRSRCSLRQYYVLTTFTGGLPFCLLAPQRCANMPRSPLRLRCGTQGLAIKRAINTRHMLLHVHHRKSQCFPSPLHPQSRLYILPDEK